jgi:hypothetical protein
MVIERDENEQRGSGVTATLRLVSALAIALLALIALLFVFDVIPRDALKDIVTKVFLVALIVGVAAGAIALVIGNRER